VLCDLASPGSARSSGCGGVSVRKASDLSLRAYRALNPDSADPLPEHSRTRRVERHRPALWEQAITRLIPVTRIAASTTDSPSQRIGTGDRYALSRGGRRCSRLLLASSAFMNQACQRLACLVTLAAPAPITLLSASWKRAQSCKSHAFVRGSGL
jgi:hypothetical protein